jgi:hypothetical protein
MPLNNTLLISKRGYLYCENGHFYTHHGKLRPDGYIICRACQRLNNRDAQRKRTLARAKERSKK